MSWYKAAQTAPAAPVAVQTADGHPIQPGAVIYWRNEKGTAYKGTVAGVQGDQVTITYQGQNTVVPAGNTYSTYQSTQINTQSRPAGMRSPAYLATLPVSQLTPEELDAVRRFSRLRKMKNRGVDVSGITPEMHDRLGPQGSACDICGRTGPVAIDHDHATGKVRGLLCQACNKGLGMFGDNAALFQKAIEYLSRYPQSEKQPYTTFKGKERSNDMSPANPYQKRQL
jgi:hypothetical protein